MQCINFGTLNLDLQLQLSKYLFDYKIHVWLILFHLDSSMYASLLYVLRDNRLINGMKMRTDAITYNNVKYFLQSRGLKINNILGILCSKEQSKERYRDHIYKFNADHYIKNIRWGDYMPLIEISISTKQFQLAKLLITSMRIYRDAKQSIWQAIIKGNIEIVKLLVSRRRTKYFIDFINYCIDNNRINIAKFLAPLSEDKRFAGSIRRAAQHGNLSMVKFLEPLNTDKNYRLAIKKASEKGHTEIVNFLMFASHEV